MAINVGTVQEQQTGKQIQTAIRHSAVYGLGGVLAKVLGFLMLPFYTHYLSPADYGLLEILDLSMSLLGMFLNMGMTAALLRCYATLEAEGEKRKAVSTALSFVGATGLLTLFLGLALVRPASVLIFGPHVPAVYLLLSFSSFILAYIANLPRTYLRALEASGTVVVVETVGLFLMLALNIYFIAVLRIGLLGILLSSLIVGFMQMMFLSAWTVREVGIRFRWTYFRQMAAFGLPLIFSNVAIFVLNFSDRFFLQHLRSLDVVGIYAVGYKFGYMLNYLIIQPFYVMWQVRMYIIHAEPDHPKIFGQIFVLYSLLLTYAGLALSMFSPEIVRLMVGPKYSSSQDVIPLVALAYIFYGIGYYSQLGMFLTNRTQLIGIISFAAAALNFVLNYVLILEYGMLGAAWATVASFLFIAAGSYWLSQRALPLPLGLNRVSLAIAVAIGLYLLSRCVGPSVGPALLAKASLLVIFPLLLWKTRLLSRAEVGTLVSTRDNTMAGVSRLLGLVSRKAVSL
jgi:O-antigen/teichoic acid export membrane protein